TEQLTERWEDLREIKNLMGKYANLIILNREQDVFGMLWDTSRTDCCLGYNEGYYDGNEAIAGYYAAVHDRNALVAGLLQKRFPEQLGEKSAEEIYGMGPFKIKPMACPVIEIAEDGKTAKGLWYCQGSYADVGPAGPVASWTWGYYAGDFTRVDGVWKIWHLLYLNDIDCICGQSWAGQQVQYPELPEFRELKEYILPEPNVKVVLRELYTPDRPLAPTPGIPQPYGSFSETFSYGIR
ncbi:MAG: SnoaL-like domain-containing protein, partial [Clostridiales bacterium]|nr:SnoaL-like domain-containing protein [Clostridiales bacterium]